MNRYHVTITHPKSGTIASDTTHPRLALQAFMDQYYYGWNDIQEMSTDDCLRAIIAGKGVVTFTTTRSDEE